jgi:sugar-phosphatase
VTPITLSAAALLFDFDGVLVDSFAVVEQVWTAWADDRGVDRAALAHIHGVRAIEVVQHLVPHLDADAEHEHIEQREIDLSAENRAMPGAADLLAGLPRDRWGIVTSGSRRLATARIGAIGLPVPDVFVTADDVAEGKPAPDPYLLGAQRLGVESAGCVVVEDAPAGVVAAKRAGMRVIAVSTTHDVERFDDPDAVIDGVASLRCSVADDGSLRIAIG